MAVLNRIDEDKRLMVDEITLDLSDSMRRIARSAFPKAIRVIDRFHIQKLACDAVQELRIKHRWDAIQQANDGMEEARINGIVYEPYRYPNGDTRKELLIRSLSPCLETSISTAPLFVSEAVLRRSKIIFSLKSTVFPMSQKNIKCTKKSKNAWYSVPKIAYKLLKTT